MASRLLVGRCVSRWLCASTRVAVPTFRRTISIPACYVPNRSSLWSVRGNSAQKRVSLLKRNYAAEGLTVEELQERLLNTIKLFDKVNPEKVHMDAHFINDLGLDSLDVVEIVMFLEDEFDVEITDEEAEKIFILKDAFELLKTKKSLN